MRDVGADPFRPERFAPEARIVDLPEWRARDGGGFELRQKTSGRWESIDAIFAAALDGLAAGEPFEGSFQRALKVKRSDLTDMQVRAHLRRFWWQLHKRGHVQIPFEAPPERFHDRYRWVRELGRGGVGVAHLCVDERLGVEVVVKHAWGYLQPPQGNDSSLRREAETLRAFDHPGIARRLDGFEDRGLYHLVREYAKGEPLSEVAKKRRLDAKEAGAIAGQVADALAHVHARGYLLLDVTPANFSLEPDGRVLLIDAGLCMPHTGGRVEMAHAVGSRGYAAVEVLDKKGATEASDAFGLGALLQFLLTGHTPGHRLTGEVRATAMHDVTDEARALVLDLCAPDPAQRPSIEETRARLNRLGSSA